MSYKRKFEADQETVSSVSKKVAPLGLGLQVMDVEMNTTSSSSPVGSISSLPSTDSPGANSPYPGFNLYPLPSGDIDMDCDNSSASSSPNSSPISSIGLLQPQVEQSDNRHSACTQIPKLRVSAYPGINGERTMWSHCPECGSMEMVRSCGGGGIMLPRH